MAKTTKSVTNTAANAATILLFGDIGMLDFGMIMENSCVEAVVNDNIPQMDKIFKTGGIQQRAIGTLIFEVKSVEMLKLFVRYGGDIHTPCPPGFPLSNPLLHSLL